mmetsp:Transcript_8845/g.26512  ORF Transcript_8845/g.26512 Transcript_8845/m.26512 type:complete len:177 (+) Transcript_8845:1054-1584(+)
MGIMAAKMRDRLRLPLFASTPMVPNHIIRLRSFLSRGCELHHHVSTAPCRVILKDIPSYDMMNSVMGHEVDMDCQFGKRAWESGITGFAEVSVLPWNLTLHQFGYVGTHLRVCTHLRCRLLLSTNQWIMACGLNEEEEHDQEVVWHRDETPEPTRSEPSDPLLSLLGRMIRRRQGG